MADVDLNTTCVTVGSMGGEHVCGTHHFPPYQRTNFYIQWKKANQVTNTTFVACSFSSLSSGVICPIQYKDKSMQQPTTVWKNTENTLNLLSTLLAL